MLNKIKQYLEVSKAKRKAKKIAKYRKEQQLTQEKLDEILRKALFAYDGKLDLENDALSLILGSNKQESNVFQINSRHYVLRYSLDLFMLEITHSLLQYHMTSVQLRMLDMEVETALYLTTVDVYQQADFMKALWNKTISNIGK